MMGRKLSDFESGPPQKPVGFWREWLAMPLQRQDSWLGVMLGVLAAIDLAATAALSANPAFWLYVGFAIFALGAAGLTALVIVLARAFSPAGILWLLFTILVFNVWNFAVMYVSVLTGWWPAQRQHGYRFLISGIVGVAPLVVGIGMLTRKSRTM